MMRRNLLFVLCFALLAGAVALFIFARSDQATGADENIEPAVQLSVEPIHPERLVLEAALSGRVAAYRRVEIRPQVGGLILERRVEEGARVVAGDLLFRIDPAPLQADLDVAEAALSRAVTAEEHARGVVARSDALLDLKIVSKGTNDNARNDLLLAASGVAEARAVVERRRLDLEFAVLRATVDGYVASGLADIGALATMGGEKPLAVLQELDKVYIDLRVPAAELDALLIAAEQGLGPVVVKADQPDGTNMLTGQLKYSDVIVDPGTGNASIRVEVANPKLALLPGMFVRATLPRGLEAEALLVPEDAVLRKGDGTAQLVIVSDQGEARRRDVQLGDRIGNRVLVTSGLAPGERVAIRGQDRVPDGTTAKVTVLAVHAPATDAAPFVPQP